MEIDQEMIKSGLTLVGAVFIVLFAVFFGWFLIRGLFIVFMMYVILRYSEGVEQTFLSLYMIFLFVERAFQMLLLLLFWMLVLQTTCT